jgi:hypothetical protein
MTALILLLIPTAILAIFLVPKSKSDIADDVTVGAGDLFPKESAIQLGGEDWFDKHNDPLSIHFVGSLNHSPITGFSRSDD